MCMYVKQWVWFAYLHLPSIVHSLVPSLCAAMSLACLSPWPIYCTESSTVSVCKAMSLVCLSPSTIYCTESSIISMWGNESGILISLIHLLSKSLALCLYVKQWVWFAYLHLPSIVQSLVPSLCEAMSLAFLSPWPIYCTESSTVSVCEAMSLVCLSLAPIYCTESSSVCLSTFRVRTLLYVHACPWHSLTHTHVCLLS